MNIFLCYRSGDDAYAATLLDEKLSEVVGRQNLFRASRSVEPGYSYAEAITSALECCDTVLVIIGPTWRAHLEKIHDTAQEDWVRIEIAAALRLRKRIVPILLSGTPRLVTNDLPPDIAALAYQQYLKFEHRNMDMDLARLLSALGLSKATTTWEHQLPPGTDEHGEFLVRRELGWDGSVELDLVRRSWDGVVMGRLSGRAHPSDLARMAALLVQPVSDEIITG